MAKEGFNITVGGSVASIEKYIEACRQHWSFAGLTEELDSDEKRNAFFKPSLGCACVFGTEGETEKIGANIRICEEITPMGVSSYIPKDWNIVESLSPAEFHSRLQTANEDGRENVLVDVRNHYESRIGYFVDPRTGEPGLRPEIRRFGQWPQFVRAHMSSTPKAFDSEELIIEDANVGERKRRQYMTYCTGGIRCEKGSRFLAENLNTEGNNVCTLKGGIQTYLMWMDEEIKSGRRTPRESLFKGKNYVFDARGSTGLTTSSVSGVAKDGKDAVANCHVCGKSEDRLSKCRSKRCHLILVVCQACDSGADPRCCEDCLALDTQADGGQTTEQKVFGKKKSRPICRCERERELKLWGAKMKTKKTNEPKPRWPRSPSPVATPSRH